MIEGGEDAPLPGEHLAHRGPGRLPRRALHHPSDVVLVLAAGDQVGGLVAVLLLVEDRVRAGRDRQRAQRLEGPALGRLRPDGARHVLLQRHLVDEEQRVPDPPDLQRASVFPGARRQRPAAGGEPDGGHRDPPAVPGRGAPDQVQPAPARRHPDHPPPRDPEQVPSGRHVPHRHEVAPGDVDASHAFPHGDPHRVGRLRRGRRPDREQQDEPGRPDAHRRERKVRIRVSTTLTRIDVVSGK